MTRPRVYAHRFSYELHHGAIPEGLFVCHTCDHPWCVNPDHLWLGTNIDNVRDAARKGRMVLPTERPFGESASSAKLTTRAVLDIRARHAQGETQTSLAREYGVHVVTVHDVVHRRTWPHVA